MPTRGQQGGGKGGGDVRGQAQGQRGQGRDPSTGAEMKHRGSRDEQSREQQTRAGLDQQKGSDRDRER